MGDDYNSPETDSQGHKSRSKVGAKMCALHDYLLRRQYGLWLLIDGRSSRFPQCRRRHLRRGVRSDLEHLSMAVFKSSFPYGPGILVLCLKLMPETSMAI